MLGLCSCGAESVVVREKGAAIVLIYGFSVSAAGCVSEAVKLERKKSVMKVC